MRYSKLKYYISRIFGYICAGSFGVSAAIISGLSVDVSAFQNVILGHMVQITFGIGCGVAIAFAIWALAIWIFIDSLWY